MPRKKPVPDPAPVPTRRKRGTGSVAVRADGRVAITLPADLDPERRPLYSPPGTRTAWASVEQAARWLDAEVARRRNPAPERATGDEQLGAYLARIVGHGFLSFLRSRWWSSSASTITAIAASG